MNYPALEALRPQATRCRDCDANVAIYCHRTAYGAHCDACYGIREKAGKLCDARTLPEIEADAVQVLVAIGRRR